MHPASAAWSSLDANGRMEVLARYLEYVGARWANYVRPLPPESWTGRFQKPGALRRDPRIRELCRKAHRVLLDRLGNESLCDDELSQLYRVILVDGGTSSDGRWGIPCLGTARDPRRNHHQPEAVSWFVRPTPLVVTISGELIPATRWISLAAVAPGIAPLRPHHPTHSRRWMRRIKRLKGLMLPDGPVRTTLYNRAREHLAHWLLRHPR